MRIEDIVRRVEGYAGPKVYAGIGSRETPSNVCIRMAEIAHILRTLGFTLNSGGAAGADQAFQAGAVMASHINIFRPEHVTEESLEFAERFHPAWDRCSSYAKRLHARNGFIVMGKDLHTPVRCVICWTKNGAVVGGTGQALRIAEHFDIPVINLALEPNSSLY